MQKLETIWLINKTSAAVGQDFIEFFFLLGSNEVKITIPQDRMTAA